MLSRFRFVEHLAPPPPAAEAVPAERVPERYRYWRNRQLFSTYIGYVVFYCLRKNMPVAVPFMMKDLHLTKGVFGLFFTLHDLTYGFAKYIAGVMADRTNPRYLLSLGLALAALANLGFSLANTLYVLGALWVINGFFQGFGFPPAARILSYWFRPKERGVKWGIFNTSHQVGTFGILALTGYLCDHYHWRACFWIPALLGLATALFLAMSLRDTPASLGLPPVEEEWESGQVEMNLRPDPVSSPTGTSDPDSEDEQENLKTLVSRRVYRNPAIWCACLANFFVYIVRITFLNWGPTYLTEVKHCTSLTGGLMTGSFEVAGLFGSLAAGYITDRFLGGRRAPACVLYMAACTVFVVLFWLAPEGNLAWATFCLSGIGFTIYGPQFLGGLMSADLAGKRAAGTAVGVHGFVGYLSSPVSGFGISHIADNYGWNNAFALLVLCSIMAGLAFVPIWNARPVDEDERSAS